MFGQVYLYSKPLPKAYDSWTLYPPPLLYEGVEDPPLIEAEPEAELRITVKPNLLGLLSDSLLQWSVIPTNTSSG